MKVLAEYGIWLQLQLWSSVQYMPQSAAVEYRAVYVTEPSSTAVECCALYAHGSFYFMYPSHWKAFQSEVWAVVRYLF